MNGQQLTVMWLRDKANELRQSGNACEKAYTRGPLHDATRYCAKYYFQCAGILEDAATAAEDDVNVIAAARMRT